MKVNPKKKLLPTSLTIADFSSAASSGIHTAALTPKEGDSIAKETPVEPAVPSVTRPPGRRRGVEEEFDLELIVVACCRIAAATRSLTDPPGLENSALARI